MCNAGSGRPSQSCGDGWELRVMIEIEVQKNKYAYNVYHLVKAFFPGEEVVQKINGKQETLAAIRMPEGSCFSIAPEGTNPDAGDVRDIQREKREVTRRVYRILSDYTGRKLAWGILTGVRPTKLAMQRLEKETEAGGHPDVDVQKRVVSYLEEEYFVSREKAVLAYQVARREQELLSRLDCRNGFSLYAGIPFCPSVCSYCSFSSSPGSAAFCAGSGIFSRGGRLGSACAGGEGQEQEEDQKKADWVFHKMGSFLLSDPSSRRRLRAEQVFCFRPACIRRRTPWGTRLPRYR